MERLLQHQRCRNAAAMPQRIHIALALLVLIAVPCYGCARVTECSFVHDPASTSRPIPDGFGVNIHFTDPQPGEIKMIAEAGFRWVRMDLKWDLTEPAKGHYDFAPYDRLMSELERFDLRALFILDYTNPLYDNGGPPRTDIGREAFARWAVAAAKHFSGREIIWETYNEPNNEAFWRPRPQVNEYAALALAVGRAFRKAVPDEKLIGPAVSEMDFPFLEGCFKAGLLEYWSAVSVHPYLRSDPENVASEYCRLREMIRAYTPVTKNPIPIISSEWGYSSVWQGLSEERQGQLLARQWLVNVANNIPLSIWYDWSDDGSDPKDPEHHFGVVFNRYYERRDPVYDPKPAYLATKTLTTILAGYQFEKRLKLDAAEDYLLVFRKGAEQRFAAWTTASNPHEVVLPFSAVRNAGKNTGQFRITSHTGQERGNITAYKGGLKLTLTSAPLYIY